MITTEYISFLESLMSSLLGMSIVFIALIFLAIFVMIVSRIISVLEKNLIKTTDTKATVSVSTTGANTKKDNKDGVKIAVITAAISEEMKQPVDKFIITSIKKI
ncbi:OadG family protein [Fusobacterium varium]|jgi:sodium pump decarboxylase gamma subunit|uniref:Sodium pump decarboxylase n=1 Tax=Fusobacterium varium ATCC 27725 TaxID=469618 RepID=A0ABN5JEW4_FUSVA|nr:OadG family protein [Fusobacterium varium]AVQ30545.1 sodium pump decarboxylase [Fusobacterium varium ATCC 27725]EES64017.1 sodium pump decarboxylase, gamma subunit [Fusobacterium varium ATCC 27725]VEH40861.1 Na+-transporting methylmalonyl-CoA/oxaloacetate decarboxylase, gamma subunit [Fusobacterium varium]